MADPADKDSLEKRDISSLQAETVASPVRRYRSAIFLLALGLAISIFALLTYLVETTPSFTVDLQITLAIQSISSPVFAFFMQLISWPGFLPQSVIVTILIAFVLYQYRLKWESAVSLLASIVSGLSNELIKGLIRRPRPGEDLVNVFVVLESYSFPSGHVMFYTILFGFIWYVVYILLKPSLTRSLILAVFGALILFVGISRIYLGHHWASDVLGAYLLGGLILAGVVFLHRWGRGRVIPHLP